MTILAATAWPSNAELIADCAALGYISEDGYTLDPTYGRGIWWKKFRPLNLVTHDIRQDGVDFCDLPYKEETFDVVAFDPPYVSVGGRATTGIPDLHDRFGLTDAGRTPIDVQSTICVGLEECYRVLKRRGTLLVKCQDYISSGKFFPGTHYTLTYALSLGFTLVDRLEMVKASPRPQPPGRRQVHARRNLSTLFVLTKRVA